MINFINAAKKEFRYYKTIGEKTFLQLNDDALFWQYNDESNSIAIIVEHMANNMLSRWTDFLTTDGEKEWRNRDAEFEQTIKGRQPMMERWNSGWNCLFAALDSINENNFGEIIYIRNQGHTITEAVNRQIAHYAYHVGQIVFIGKMIMGNKWQSLSIPKGGSAKFNEEKFSHEKQQQHFTDKS